MIYLLIEYLQEWWTILEKDGVENELFVHGRVVVWSQGVSQALQTISEEKGNL